MEYELIAVLSVLEGGLYTEVKEFWKIFEERFGASAVQIFEHPSFTIQGGSITQDQLELLRHNFQKFAERLKPYVLKVRELGHIGYDSIYFKVELDEELQAVNILVNAFLNIFCDDLINDYTPEHFKPHIALAINDLEEHNFRRAWAEFGSISYQYDQPIHNLYLVKFEKNGSVTVLEKAKIQEAQEKPELIN